MQQIPTWNGTVERELEIVKATAANVAESLKNSGHLEDRFAKWDAIWEQARNSRVIQAHYNEFINQVGISIFRLLD